MAAAIVDHFGFHFPLEHEQEFDVLGKYTVIYAFALLLAMAIAPKDDKVASGNLLLWLVVNPIIVFWVCKHAELDQAIRLLAQQSGYDA